MRALKGFVTIQSLTNNVATKVSAIGEMSTLSRTFSREIGEYGDASYPGFNLVSMFSRDESNNAIVLPANLVQEVLGIVSQMYTYAVGHTTSYDVEDLKNNVIASYFGSITLLTCGDLENNGVVALPQWVKWTSVNTGTEVIIWLSDTAFKEQYPEFSIVVIPPVENIDDMFLNFETVQSAVALRDLSVLLEEAQDAKEGQPETYTRTMSYTYYSPFISSDQLQLTWLVMVYGTQGDNQDSIRDAIIEYVEKNTSRTNAEWMAIMPEIFKRTEFVILPRWDRMAIENMSVQAGLYSCLSNPIEMVSFAKNQIDFYEDAHIEANTLGVPVPYKGLNLVVVDGPENIEAKADFATYFSDYLCISTTSLDFNRMSDLTRNFCILLNDMLVYAEDLTEISTVSSNMRKIKRNGKLYLSSVYSGVNILVAAATNYQEL